VAGVPAAVDPAAGADLASIGRATVSDPGSGMTEACSPRDLAAEPNAGAEATDEDPDEDADDDEDADEEVGAGSANALTGGRTAACGVLVGGITRNN